MHGWYLQYLKRVLPYHILFVESAYLHLNTFKFLRHYDKQLFQVSAKIFIDGQSFKDHCANQTAWIFWISILSTYKLKTSKSNWSQMSAEDNEQWRPRRLRPCSNGAHWHMVPPSAGHGEVMGNPTPVMDTDNTINGGHISVHPSTSSPDNINMSF